MSVPEIQVLYEDNHLLVINKPAELATMGALVGEPTAVAWAADYIKQRYQKPGNVFVGVVSRLDSFVTGVLILARTSKAASRLTEQFRERQTQKLYLACVEGQLHEPNWKTLSAHIAKNDAAHRMAIVSPKSPEAQLATLQFRTLASTSNRSLLEIDLGTGRKHQIRLQLSDHGHPIVGDSKYGASSKFPRGIALHASKLTIEHPTLRTSMTFAAPVPPTWHGLPEEILRKAQVLSQN
ncbi:MAG: RluA family pseudouridine synthase [Pirellulaceae bacterium]|nr:RluA family pseudouridine synthase [Pirellulaceae bacterium]